MYSIQSTGQPINQSTKPIILLIETATEVCGAGISINGILACSREETNTMNHATLLTTQIKECLDELGITLKDIDAVAVSSGPGSYTSLRVGVSVAKGICYATGKPLIAIDTLYALAFQSKKSLEEKNSEIFKKNNTYISMIDARRMEVCLSLYDNDLLPILRAEPKILENNMFDKVVSENFQLKNTDWFIFSGSGSKKITDVLNFEKTVFYSIDSCSVSHMSYLSNISFQLSDFQALAYFEPTYMKPPNITTTRNTYF
jgi:tRNA threonylcarbamoyladenosine biosynthesis protein TsaB